MPWGRREEIRDDEELFIWDKELKYSSILEKLSLLEKVFSPVLTIINQSLSSFLIIFKEEFIGFDEDIFDIFGEGEREKF